MTQPIPLSPMPMKAGFAEPLGAAHMLAETVQKFLEGELGDKAKDDLNVALEAFKQLYRENVANLEILAIDIARARERADDELEIDDHPMSHVGWDKDGIWINAWIWQRSGGFDNEESLEDAYDRLDEASEEVDSSRDGSPLRHGFRFRNVVYVAGTSKRQVMASMEKHVSGFVKA